MQEPQKQPDRRNDRAESQPEPAPAPPDRAGRRYAVSSQKGRARGKVRYIETNDPSKGCRFL